MPDCCDPRIAASRFKRNVTNRFLKASPDSSLPYRNDNGVAALCAWDANAGERPSIGQIITGCCQHLSDRRVRVSERIVLECAQTRSAFGFPTHGLRWSSWIAPDRRTGHGRTAAMTAIEVRRRWYRYPTDNRGAAPGPAVDAGVGRVNVPAGNRSLPADWPAAFSCLGYDQPVLRGRRAAKSSMIITF
jgi:hypothetical protein